MRPWCMRFHACRVAKRRPFVPQHAIRLDILGAQPSTYVATEHGSDRMVSMIAMPALMLPPEPFTYIAISASGSADARYRSCAQIEFAIPLRISPEHITTRSASSLDHMSYCRSRPPSLSMTYGTYSGPSPSLASG